MPEKLLFISQQFPWPLTDGGNIRSFRILKALASRFRVTLVASLPSNQAPDEYLAALKPLCEKVIVVADEKRPGLAPKVFAAIQALTQASPLAIAWNRNQGLNRAVAKLLAEEKFAAIHLNHLDTWQSLAGAHPTQVVLDSHNLLFELYERMARLGHPLKRLFWGWEARRMKAYERRAFASMDAVIVCSPREAGLIREEAKRVIVATNGVDCSSFAPPVNGYSGNAPALVFTGAMGYAANADAALWFIREIMPALRKRIPGVGFLVVGRNPPPDLVAEGQGHSDVTVTGGVPDVRPYVHRARAFVVPLRQGAGTRLKVLEAFAFGIPTVSTQVGAEGIECEAGRHILFADSAEAMVETLARCLGDADLQSRLSRESRELAVAQYDWNSIGLALLAGYEQTLSAKKTA